MNKEDFTAHLDTFGASLNRWPAHLRMEAEAAMRNDPALRKLHEAGIAFEMMLLEAERPAPSPGFAERIAAGAIAEPRPSGRLFHRAIIAWFRNEFPLPSPVFTLPVLAMAGILLGAAVTGSAASETQQVFPAFFHLDELAL